MVALLSAAAQFFRAWVSVEILGVEFCYLLAVAGRCYRAQPLINIEGATKHKHGMTCAAELFYLRHVRSCAATRLAGCRHNTICLVIFAIWNVVVI